MIWNTLPELVEEAYSGVIKKMEYIKKEENENKAYQKENKLGSETCWLTPSANGPIGCSASVI